jgi:hypothetical protein
VSAATLQRRIRGKPSREEFIAPGLKLSASEEEVLIEEILKRDAQGLAPTQANVRDMANAILRARTSNQEEEVGVNWASRFIRRNPRLSEKIGRAYDRPPTAPAPDKKDRLYTQLDISTSQIASAVRQLAEDARNLAASAAVLEQKIQELEDTTRGIAARRKRGKKPPATDTAMPDVQGQAIVALGIIDNEDAEGEDAGEEGVGEVRGEEAGGGEEEEEEIRLGGEAGEGEAGPSRRTRQITCSHCGQRGHTRRSCVLLLE